MCSDHATGCRLLPQQGNDQQWEGDGKSDGESQAEQEDEGERALIRRGCLSLLHDCLHPKRGMHVAYTRAWALSTPSVAGRVASVPTTAVHGVRDAGGPGAYSSAAVPQPCTQHSSVGSALARGFRSLPGCNTHSER